jgi:NAD(P)-dependent dehydrogenase (short-subunit alcohol dehydrogenase family)
MRQTALITGGTRGIGLGIATELAAAGFDIAINGVRAADAVVPVIDELKKFGGEVIYCQADIASAVERERMVEQVRKAFGWLNLLVNNAGVAPKERKDILEASEESFVYLLSTNLQGPYFLTQKVANWMIEKKKEAGAFEASIINITSVSAEVASVNRGEYCVAKAGLSMATQLFAARLGEFNIPVYEIRPGIIKTDMTAGVTEKYDKLIGEGLTVQNRWGESSDVGKAVKALALKYFPYSTGQVFNVDGGMMVRRL